MLHVVIVLWLGSKPKQRDKQPTTETIESLEFALADAKLRLDDTREELSATKSGLRECQCQLAVTKEELDDCRGELAMAKRNMESARKEVADARSKAESVHNQLRLENATLRADLAAANRKLDFAQVRLHEVQKQLGSEHTNGQNGFPWAPGGMQARYPK